jgi:DNA-binding NarL/FixJ family response regulator
LTTSPKIRMVLIDDHELFRAGIAMIVNMDKRFEVVGEGDTSDAAVELCERHLPNILLLDVELNDDPAQSTIRRALRASPTTRIVMLTMHRDALIRKTLLRAGATAFLTKSMRKDELLAALAMLATRPAESRVTSILDAALLSSRELEVLRLLATSHPMQEIAVELGIAAGTVKRHTNAIYRKLEVSSRIQAVPKAQLLGLLDTPRK